MKTLCKIVILAFLLNGCARKDPVENVIDYHQQHIADVLDYAYNNIDQNKDVIFLENELKNCDIALLDIKQAYYGQISTCRAEKKYWQLATGGLVVILFLVLYACILHKRF